VAKLQSASSCPHCSDAGAQRKNAKNPQKQNGLTGGLAMASLDFFREMRLFRPIRPLPEEERRSYRLGPCHSILFQSESSADSGVSNRVIGFAQSPVGLVTTAAGFTSLL
jgi:hypothetical protein